MLLKKYSGLAAALPAEDFDPPALVRRLHFADTNPLALVR